MLQGILGSHTYGIAHRPGGVGGHGLPFVRGVIRIHARGIVHVFHRHVQGLGGDLAHNRIHALPNFNRTGKYRGGSILVEADDGAALGIGAHHGRFHEAGQAAPGALAAASAVPGWRRLFLKGFLHRFQAQIRPAVVALHHLAQRIHLSLREQVLQAQFGRIHPQTAGDLIHLALHHPMHLRMPVPPIGASRRCVGVHRMRIQAQVGHVIGPGGIVPAALADPDRIIRIAAAAKIHLGFFGQQHPIRIHSRFDPSPCSAPHDGPEEGLFAG